MFDLSCIHVYVRTQLTGVQSNAKRCVYTVRVANYFFSLLSCTLFNVMSVRVCVVRKPNDYMFPKPGNR